MGELKSKVARAIHTLRDFFKRIGCIGCPLGGAKSQYREFGLYPKIKANYIRAFDRMINASPHLYQTWKTGIDVFQWWLGEMPGQMSPLTMS